MLRLAVLAFAAASMLAGPALCADEEWLVVGGDGTALAYDRTSIKKSGDLVSFRQGGFSTVAIPPPPAIGGPDYHGLVGDMSVNCKDRTALSGATTFYLVTGAERTLEAPPAAKFTPVPPGDSRAYFVPIVCGERPPVDPHIAVGRKEGLATMKLLAAKKRVTASAKVGWTFALSLPPSLTAIDTSSWKREGDIVSQTEITWMRKDQVNDGLSWRYSVIPFEYDCVVGRRRAKGMLQFYAANNTLAHEEPVEGAWALLPPSSPGSLLFDMACNGKKLAGLPSGPRAAMIIRLRELAVLQ